jgi:hypothetical protein
MNLLVVALTQRADAHLLHLAFIAPRCRFSGSRARLPKGAYQRRNI